MIQYANRGTKAYLALLLCMNGSVVPSALPPAITSTAMSIALALTQNQGEEIVPDLTWANQAFAIQIYAIILGFLIVTRSNMALSRYTNAMQGLQVMTSKWLDAYMQLCAFVNAHLEAGPQTDAMKTLLEWREQLAHWFSLMATFAVAQLRGDEEGKGPEFSERSRDSRSSDASSSEVDVVKLRTNASGMFKRKELQRPNPTKSSNKQPSSEDEEEDDGGRANMPRPAPLERKGTLAALQAKAGHAASVADLFFGSMSDMGRSDACSWPRNVDAKLSSGQINLEYLGSCTSAEKAVLGQVHDKVLVVSGWICESITRTLMRNRPDPPPGPILKTPPPVVSRVYQELSNGMQAYHQAMMVVIVPFPFPFAQMLTYLLLGFTFLAPFMVLQFTRSVIFSPILTFVAVFGYYGTDSIAKEIENPFGEDTNDLPLLGMHRDFNNAIKELLLPHPHLMDMGIITEDPLVRDDI